jgi:hypothetical protein
MKRDDDDAADIRESGRAENRRKRHFVAAASRLGKYDLFAPALATAHPFDPSHAFPKGLFGARKNPRRFSAWGSSVCRRPFNVTSSQ